MKKNVVVQELLKKLEAGVTGIKTSEQWREYLRFQARFHQYSFNNTLLILLQCPHASMVAGFSKWKELGRKVKKGEKAIKILVPLIKKETEIDDETGEEKEIQRIYGFKYANVFDISQTEGKPVPSLVRKLEGHEVEGQKITDALSEITPIPVRFKENTGSANGWYDLKKNEIVIKSSLSTLHKAKTWIHELAHSRLHNIEKQKEEKKSRSEKEAEAEGTAFVVLSYFGLDTSDYSFGYIAGWEGDQEILKRVGQTIQRESKKIIEEIEAAMEKLEISMKTNVSA